MSKNDKSIIIYKNNPLIMDKDASNNTLFSKKKLTLSSNLDISPLLPCNKKINYIPNNQLVVKKKISPMNINKNCSQFNMTIEKLLKNFNNEREKNIRKFNKEKLENVKLVGKAPNKYIEFIKGLDNIADKPIEPPKKDTPRRDNKSIQTNEKNDLINSLNLMNNSYRSNHYNTSSFTGFNDIFSNKSNNPDDNDLHRPLFSQSTNSFNTGYTSQERARDIFSRPNPMEQPVIKKRKVKIDIEIDSIKDLIKLCDDYPLEVDVEYNINMKAIHAIKTPLSSLDSMVGLNALKENIVDQILYYIQDLHNSSSYQNQDFMHTVIYGPPGTGKTEAAKLIGKIFSNLGILKRGTFRKVVRSDLIAGYLGQTALKTRDVIRDCLGGVLFIDEAYALGNSEKRDSFAKECIDTLCEALSDYKDELMVIIAGYENELKTCLFEYNQGLESRFTWRFKTDDYNAEELKLIFEKKVKDAGWSMKNKNDLDTEWFEKNMDDFKFFGRDMETLFSKTKIAHSRRVFCKDKDEKTKLIMKDMEKGLIMYLKNNDSEEKTKRKKMEENIMKNMYL